MTSPMSAHAAEKSVRYVSHRRTGDDRFPGSGASGT